MKRFQVFGSVGCGRIRVNRRVSNCTFVKKVSFSVPHARGKIAWPSSTVRYFQFEGGGRANPRCWRPFRGVGCKLPGKLQRRLAVISHSRNRPTSISIYPDSTSDRTRRFDQNFLLFPRLVCIPAWIYRNFNSNSAHLSKTRFFSPPPLPLKIKTARYKYSSVTER